MASAKSNSTVGLGSVEQIVLVLSGKGGVGKSSVSVQLALALALAGKRVGLLDVDLCGPSIPRMMNLLGERIVQGTEGWKPVLLEKAVAPDGSPIAPIKIMSIGFLLPNPDDAIVWRGPKKTSMIGRFFNSVEWGELDFLVVDTPPGTSDEHIAVVENLFSQARTMEGSVTGVSSSSSSPQVSTIIVTTPQLVALADVARIIGFCHTVGLPIRGLIENMSGYLCPHCSECTNLFSREGGIQLANRYGIRFLCQVPIAPAFTHLMDAESDDEEAKPLITAYINRTPELYRIFADVAATIIS